MNPSIVSLDGQNKEETVILPTVMADATKKKKREGPNNQTHERPDQTFSIYVQIPETEVPYSGIYIFSTLLKLPSET